MECTARMRTPQSAERYLDGGRSRNPELEPPRITPIKLDFPGFPWISLDAPCDGIPCNPRHTPRASASPSTERQPPSPASAGRCWRPAKMQANPPPRSPNTTYDPRSTWINLDQPGSTWINLNQLRRALAFRAPASNSALCLCAFVPLCEPLPVPFRSLTS